MIALSKGSRSRVPLLLSIAIVSCASIPPQSRSRGAPAFDRQTWLDDYTSLRAHLERSYANLLWFASPAGGVDLPALHARTLSALKAAPNEAAAEAAIESFVNGFGDGHFSRLPRA